MGQRLLGATAALALVGPLSVGGAPPLDGRPWHALAAPADECVVAPPEVARGVPWAQQRLEPERAWAFSTGATVVVAVVDSGVDVSTPQLAGRVEPGIDVLSSGRADSDCLGHGTFVAGIIAAAPTWGIGFAGVAPDARILPIRATNATDGNPLTFARGIRAAVDAGAKVVNVSASTVEPVPELLDAVAYAESHDVLVVASTARDSTSTAPVYPAAAPTVLAVAAVDPFGVPASFSRPGTYIDLAAPGVDITSIGPGGPGHLVASGTSYAAAFVSGVAALVRAYRPGLTAAQVRHRLRTTADHAPAVPDSALGWGIVDPLAALTTVLPEEGPGAATVPAVPESVEVVIPPPDRTGRGLVLLAAGAMVLVAGIAGLLAVLGPAGHRRRWRPARVMRVTGDAPEPDR